jgi:hypothetical protein
MDALVTALMLQLMLSYTCTGSVEAAINSNDNLTIGVGSFSFDSSSEEEDIAGFMSKTTMQGNTTIGSNKIYWLTPDPREQQKAQMNQLIGRLVYNTPLGALGNITSLASIVSMESTFKFQFITPPIETNTGGDGMTFFISPARSIPAKSSGGGLGIINEATGNATNSSLHLFAVEFDTYKNPPFTDPNNNHVGIDINSLVSVVTASIGPDSSLQSDLDLYSNSSFLVWIDYYSANLSIEVRMITAETTSSSSSSPPPPSSSFSDVIRPPDPLLILTHNLSALLGDPGLDMFVGLSATTGNNFQGCAIYSWDFALTVVQPAIASNSTGVSDFPPLGAAEPATTTGSSNVLRKLLIPAIIAVAVFVVGFIAAVLAYRKRQRRHGANDDVDPHVQELRPTRHGSLRNRHYNRLSGPAAALANELPSITHDTRVPAALTQYKFEELVHANGAEWCMCTQTARCTAM